MESDGENMINEEQWKVKQSCNQISGITMFITENHLESAGREALYWIDSGNMQEKQQFDEV